MTAAAVEGDRPALSTAGFERHITKTQFWNELMHDVYGPRYGGAIVFVDAENARKGVAKTTAAVAMARLVSRAFGYGMAHDDLQLAGSRYVRRYLDHPGPEQPSALVADELVGAGAGDARRATTHGNVNMGRAWQLLRAKRVVTFVTLPDWNEADPRLQKYADYRLWCRERPIGFFQPYKVTTPFHSGGADRQVGLKGLSYSETRKADRIGFPNLDRLDDPYYQYLVELKEELTQSDSWSIDDLHAEDEEDQLSEDEVQRREYTRIAIRLYEPWTDQTDRSYEDIAAVIDERSDGWVGQIIREWKRGEHRDLVPAPEGYDE